MFLPGEPVCSLHCFCQGRQFAHYTVYAVGEGGRKGESLLCTFDVAVCSTFCMPGAPICWLHCFCQGRQFAPYTVFARCATILVTLFVPPGEGLEEGRGVCSVHLMWQFALYMFLPGATICSLYCFCQGRQFPPYTVFARGAS